MPTLLELFAVKGSSGELVKGDDGQPLYFNSKMAAKAVRNGLGDSYTITPGPDHYKFNNHKE